MSRIGKKEITIPNGVEVTVENQDGGQIVKVKGPKGELSRQFRPEIIITQEENEVKVARQDDTRMARSLHGLSRTLLNNMILGVSQGFKKELEIVGVGYRAALKGANLDFQLGKSHPVVIEPPSGIEFKVEANTKVTVSGPDKELVGQIAANIIALRPPEPYKGKGIRIAGQRIKRKAGKSAAK
ncbi:MAG: 50S ribosomal protein L6 [Candidatus Melainabacteria bacterium]|nr:50S ribosomal protein L6 [Candidatus Melainabacteria bacterium]